VCRLSGLLCLYKLVKDGIFNPGAPVLERMDYSIKSNFRIKTTDEIALLLFEQIDKALRESHGGQFWNFDGTKIEW
jgi:hypothetical protein